MSACRRQLLEGRVRPVYAVRVRLELRGLCSIDPTPRSGANRQERRGRLVRPARTAAKMAPIESSETGLGVLPRHFS